VETQPSDQLPALLFILSGPAGSGKTTLCDRLTTETPGLERVVTSTTRKPREGEVDGRDYYFLDDVEFDRLIEEGAFLEWAHVHTHRYGTLRRVVEEKIGQNIDLCMNVDVQGAASFRKAAESDPLLRQRLVTVFLMPKDLEVLRARLRRRATDPEDEIKRRLQTATSELGEWTHYDFCVQSKSKEEDFEVIKGIWRSEKRRVSRMRVPGE
jgi:guanylate kinase